MVSQYINPPSSRYASHVRQPVYRAAELSQACTQYKRKLSDCEAPYSQLLGPHLDLQMPWKNCRKTGNWKTQDSLEFDESILCQLGMNLATLGVWDQTSQISFRILNHAFWGKTAKTWVAGFLKIKIPGPETLWPMDAKVCMFWVQIPGLYWAFDYLFYLFVGCRICKNRTKPTGAHAPGCIYMISIWNLGRCYIALVTAIYLITITI